MIAEKSGVAHKYFTGAISRLSLIELVVIAVMALPTFALAWLALGNFGTEGGLFSRMLPVALRETGLLLLLVGLFAGAIGMVSAWLVSTFEFPGRRLFEWALILPLAIPTYISAYAWVEVMDFTGPLQSFIRALTGAKTVKEYWFPDFRTIGGGAFVMSLVLYPYVYLSCRAFFLMQSGAMAAASRTLGAGPWRTFKDVTLPLARPAIIVGVSLALMEVINDVGAVEFFGVNTMTAIVYATWLNQSNLPGAAQLAVTAVLLIAGLIWLEQHERRKLSYLNKRDSRVPPPRTKLRAAHAIWVSLFCAAIVGLGFVVPVLELLSTAIVRFMRGAVDGEILEALWTTVWLALIGALICVAVGYFTARRMVNADGSRNLSYLATFGYAVPGTILAIGIVVPLGFLDGVINDATRAWFGVTVGLVLSGSPIAIIYAYSVRFLTVSHNSLESAMKKRGTSLMEAAHVLGANRWRTLIEVDLPTLRPALVAALTLVFVECIKELPATLLLRPLGLETLATFVYAEASLENFESAAVPALLIIFIALVPAVLGGKLQGSEREG